MKKKSSSKTKPTGKGHTQRGGRIRRVKSIDQVILESAGLKDCEIQAIMKVITPAYIDNYNDTLEENFIQDTNRHEGIIEAQNNCEQTCDCPRCTFLVIDGNWEKVVEKYKTDKQMLRDIVSGLDKLQRSINH